MVEPGVAASLHDYMKKRRAAHPVASCAERRPTRSHELGRVHDCGFGRVHVGKNMGGTRYRTQLVIRGLRIYALAKQYEEAIEQHVILAQMRDAIASESRLDHSLWTNHEKLLGLLEGALKENNTSEQEMKLHTYVYMKAAPWLHTGAVISSPTMQLSEAIVVYSRLLLAHSASWERLRAEWVQILLVQRKGLARSRIEAEAVADQARKVTLEKQFRHVQLGVKCAMRREKAQAAASKRDAIRRRRQYFQQRWLRRKDLTMEDMMNESRV